MEQLIIKLAAAINMRTLYPANHPRVLEAVQLVIAALTTILEEGETDSITFIIVGDDLAVGQTPLRKASLPKRQFVQILKRRGIERLTLGAGLDAEEGDQLITALATNETPKSSPHVVLGRVQLMLGDEQQAAATEPPRRELSAEQLEPVRDLVDQLGVEDVNFQPVGQHLAHRLPPGSELAANRDHRHADSNLLHQAGS